MNPKAYLCSADLEMGLATRGYLLNFWLIRYLQLLTIRHDGA